MIDILKILQVESIYFSELWQRIIERLERGDSVRLWEVWREETKRKTGLSPICFWDRKNNIFCRRWDVH